MLWAPNYGGGYPFASGQYNALPGTSDFALLDTNHDGVLNMSDDPYLPYYPGDDAVDWVGMSLYHWGSR
jgi:soluble lytic murein transglycosylase-like protein